MRPLSFHLVFLYIGSLHNVKSISAWFSIKYLFRKYPAATTATALVCDWALTSAALNIIER